MIRAGGGGPRVVPVYAITGGRTRSHGQDLPLETLVTTTERGVASRDSLRFEQGHIADLCHAPMSVVEVAAKLRIPVGVARVLVSDLHADDILSIHRPPLTPEGRPQTEVLERLLRGLRTQ
jgi:hypothetical protein